MEKPQPTLPAPVLGIPGKPFKITMSVEFGGVIYDDKIKPEDLVKRGLLKFYNWFQIRSETEWPYGKPSELVMGGQVFNIEVKEDKN